MNLEVIMGAKELLNTYPRVYDRIKEWYIQKMMKSMPSIEAPEEFKNYMKDTETINRLIENLIDKNPAALFEIFDNVGVYAEVSVIIDVIKPYFTYKVHISSPPSIIPSREMYTRRMDAEYYAMMEAVQYIEENFEKLYNDKSEEKLTEDVK